MSTSVGNAIEWQRDFPVPSAQAAKELAEDPEQAEPIQAPSDGDIRASLAEHNGNIVRTTKALGLSSRYVLYRLMRKYGIAST